MRYILLLLFVIFGGIYMLFFKASPTSPAKAKAAVSPVTASSKASDGNFLKRPLDHAQGALDQARANTSANKF